jgi:putative glutathione S-transferase
LGGRIESRETNSPRRLYASFASTCSHRALLVRELCEADVELVELRPIVGDRGWELCEPEGDAETLDDLCGGVDRAEEGPIAAPLLWDIDAGRAASDDWRHIAAQLVAGELARGSVAVAAEAILETLDAALYNAGFATEQASYERWSAQVFDALAECDRHLARRSFWSGPDIGLFDLFLFTTLYRFELVYHTHFLCNRRRLTDYDNLPAYLQRIYATPGVAGTCRPDLIKAHYFAGQRGLNPAGLIPTGPELSWLAEHRAGHDHDDPVKGAARRLDS